MKPSEVVHVGDELEWYVSRTLISPSSVFRCSRFSDYHGATRAGLQALLLRGPSEDPMVDEDPVKRMDEKIRRIESLDEVVRFVQEHNV